MLLSNYSIHAFIQEHQIKTETGQPLDFHTHRFLFDIYRDNSKNIVGEKAAQIGWTTLEIINSLWSAKNQRMDIIYVLPTANDVRDFSGGKTNRIIANNPIFQEWTKDKDSIEQKQIGGNTIYYRGSWTDRAALMISADWLILDEFDRAKQEILEQYESRLQHSKIGKKSIFSNPSIPGFGVDKYFQKTDKKKWHITHSCGKNYVMDESCIDYTAEIYRCPHCAGEIIDEERRMGEWVATAQGEEGWSGYWIPLWIAPWVSAKKIAEYKKTKPADYFANFVAGLPYVGGGNKVSEDIIFRNLTNKVNSQEGRIVIGVDTGIPIHYVLGNKEGLFYYGTCADYAPLESYLLRWPNSIIVSDQGGDLIGIRQLKEKYPGRVFLCFYRQDTKNFELIRWGEKEEYGKVTVDRNRMIQFVIDEFTDKRVPLQGNSTDWHEYLTHWLNIYRFKEGEENDPEYKWRYVWGRVGPDHYVHGTVYWRVGMDKFGQGQGAFVGATVEFGEKGMFL